MVANPLLFVERACLYVVTTICRFAREQNEQDINLCNEFRLGRRKMGNNHTLMYLVPTQYDPLSVTDVNTGNDNVIHTISTTVSEAEVERLPPIPVESKTVFPGK